MHSLLRRQYSERTLAVLGVGLIVVLGSLLHFTYAWSGDNFFVGLISPINESIWEHSKLFLLPLALLGFFEYRSFKQLDKVLFGKLLEFVSMSLFITAFFYTYTGAFGVEESLLVDIFSFILAAEIGQFISYKILVSKSTPPLSANASAALLILIFGLFVYFTLYPPAIPLFESHA